MVPQSSEMGSSFVVSWSTRSASPGIWQGIWQVTEGTGGGTDELISALPDSSPSSSEDSIAGGADGTGGAANQEPWSMCRRITAIGV